MTDIEVTLGGTSGWRAAGLEANLSGAIRLRGNFPEAPRATGTVDLVTALPDRRPQLRIARGRVVFDGPLHDPSLEHRRDQGASRGGPGFEISGHASAPQIRLVSESQVTDTRSRALRKARWRPSCKRLASRLFGTYEQSLRGVWNILKLQYEITDRLSLSVQAGSDSALDLLWFFPFD